MKKSPRRYLLLLFACCAACIALIGAINYTVDPIGIYHIGQTGGFIRSRPQIGSYMAMYKAHAVIPAAPNIVFLGHSRSHEGLDPHHLGQEAFNLALPGSASYDNLRYLQHASASHKPQIAILGIDFEFLSAGRGFTPDFSEDRLLVGPHGDRNRFSTLYDIPASLFSVSALLCSAQTIASQKEPYVTYDHGYGGDPSLIAGHWDSAARVRTFNSAVSGNSPGIFRQPNAIAPELAHFDDLLTFCNQQGIRLIVFVHPTHAFLLDKWTSDWDQYSDFMKSAASDVAKYGGPLCTFWDFAGYNEISTEKFPGPDETSNHMKYYSECSHYRAYVGNLVLDRILARPGALPKFGTLIAPSDVDADLSRLKNEQEAWHLHGLLAPLGGPLPPGATALVP